MPAPMPSMPAMPLPMATDVYKRQLPVFLLHALGLHGVGGLAERLAQILPPHGHWQTEMCIRDSTQAPAHVSRGLACPEVGQVAQADGVEPEHVVQSVVQAGGDQIGRAHV